MKKENIVNLTDIWTETEKICNMVHKIALQANTYSLEKQVEAFEKELIKKFGKEKEIVGGLAWDIKNKLKLKHVKYFALEENKPLREKGAVVWGELNLKKPSISTIVFEEAFLIELIKNSTKKNWRKVDEVLKLSIVHEVTHLIDKNKKEIREELLKGGSYDSEDKIKES